LFLEEKVKNQTLPLYLSACKISYPTLPMF
jgi:hypothetical protein